MSIHPFVQGFVAKALVANLPTADKCAELAAKLARALHRTAKIMAGQEPDK